MSGALVSLTAKMPPTLSPEVPRPPTMALLQLCENPRRKHQNTPTPDCRDDEVVCVLEETKQNQKVDSTTIAIKLIQCNTNCCAGVQFSSMLHVARYPYIGLLSGSGSRIKRVAASEGLATPADLMQVLQPAVEQHGAQFVTDQADHNERVWYDLAQTLAHV